MTPARRAPSIAVPIFLLAVGAVVAAAILTFALTFAAPPPRPAPLAFVEIAAVADGRGQKDRNARRLERLADAAQATPRPGERADPAADAALSRGVGRVVRGFYEERAPIGAHEVRGGFTLAIPAADGRTVVLRTQAQPTLGAWHRVALAALAGVFVLLLLVAWGVARAISRPLRALAAKAAGARPGQPPLLPAAGPREVRQLSESISAMHRRLAGHAAERTAMLAAIAHDLGTPLSRIAFWIEQLPEAARERAAGDIEEMRAMLGDVLRFARDERTGVAPQRIDLGSLLDSLADDLAAAGQPVLLSPGPRAVVTGDARALRRAFANLLDNALRYGRFARLGWSVEGDRAIVTIEDDGPGIDDDDAERLFAPFVRGDPSRNRATGGTGLGLAIVRSIVEAHGGTAALGRATAGGGLATVVVPLSA